MRVIENFIKQYEKEYDFYRQLARIANEIIEDKINDRALKAIVSHRAKRIDRLREKLYDRHKKKNYKSKRSIEKDIVDLAGVRIALYFPSDKNIIDELIEDSFKIVERKEFPENPHKPKPNKRFSGYWATHYRVKIKKNDDLIERFTKTVFEIQVASVLMHAWAEVEHDLVYKPYSGKLHEDELAILDEINGLVMAGEIALERLQKAITERTKKQREIKSTYELTNLVANFDKKYYQNIKLGNTEFLNSYLKAVESLKTSEVIKSLRNINTNLNKSLSDQLLNSFVNLEENIKSDNIKKYLNAINPEIQNQSPFELFVKTWIVFEKATRQINQENDTSSDKRYFIPNTKLLSKLKIINKQEETELRDYRAIRNNLLHGNSRPSNENLQNSYNRLREITSKVISNINEMKVRDKLNKELEEIK